MKFNEKFLKFVFKTFYSDHAFWDFLDTCNTFSVLKKLVNKSFEILAIEQGRKRP